MITIAWTFLALSIACVAWLAFEAHRAPYDSHDGPWEDLRPARRTRIPGVDLEA